MSPDNDISIAMTLMKSLYSVESHINVTSVCDAVSNSIQTNAMLKSYCRVLSENRLTVTTKSYFIKNSIQVCNFFK